MVLPKVLLSEVNDFTRDDTVNQNSNKFTVSFVYTWPTQSQVGSAIPALASPPC